MLVRQMEFSASSVSIWLSYQSFNFLGLATGILYVFNRASFEKIGWLLFATSILLALTAIIVGVIGIKRGSELSKDGVVTGGILVILEVCLAIIYILYSIST